MYDWKELLLVVIFLTIGVTCSPVGGIEDKVEVQCISEYGQYCKGKPYGLMFSDGCRECKCTKGAVLCRKGRCSSFPKPGEDILDYCDSISERNSRRLVNKTNGSVHQDSQNSTIHKVDLSSGKAEELTDKEKAEAAIRIEKLYGSYVSNQPKAVAPDSLLKANHDSQILAENVEQKPPEGFPSNFDVKSHFTKIMPHSRLAGESGLSEDEQSTYDPSRIYHQTESILMNKRQRKESPLFNNKDIPNQLSKYLSTSRFKSPDVNSIDDVTMTTPSRYGRKESVFRRLPKINRRSGSTNRRGQNLLYTPASYHRRYPLTSRFNRIRGQFMDDTVIWPSLGRVLPDRNHDNVEEHHFPIPARRYEPLKNLAENNHEDYLTKRLARHRIQQKGSSAKVEENNSKIKSSKNYSSYKSDEAGPSEMEQTYPDFIETRKGSAIEKNQLEILHEIRSFIALSEMASNLLMSENISPNKSNARNPRNKNKFMHLVSIIKANIHALEADVEGTLSQTASNKHQFFIDIVERLNDLFGLTKEAMFTVGGSGDSSDNFVNQQLDGICVMMEDIISSVSTKLEKEMEIWNAEEIWREYYSPHDVDDDWRLGEADEIAVLRRKLAKCMLLCARCL